VREVNEQICEAFEKDTRNTLDKSKKQQKKRQEAGEIDGRSNQENIDK
jgi:hypothetical protein